MGEIKEASRLYDEMIKQGKNLTSLSAIDRNTNDDQANITLIKGEINLAKGNVAEAIETFESLFQWHLQNTYIMESLAFAYLRAGLLKEAAQKYEEIISFSQLGYERQEIWILAHYELGQIYRDLGSMEKAKEYYAKFLDLWKDADRDIPILQKARVEYEKLRLGSDRL